MISAEDIYSMKVKAGQRFVVTATNETVFITDFVTASLDKDGKKMKAVADDGRVFDITELDICTG